jgi:putative salt-induced outer membrane protein YdiY
VLVFAIATVSPAWASAQQVTAGPDDAADLREVESALLAALHARDRTRLDALLASDFVLRGAPDVDRETWLRNATSLCWGDRSEITDFLVRSQGPFAIVSFVLTFFTDPFSCRPAVLRSVITDVWVRNAGGWKLQMRFAGAPLDPDAGVANQYGIVPAPPPAWYVSGEVSAVATAGNTSTRTLGMGAQLFHQRDRRESKLSTSFLTTQADGVTKARSLAATARHAISVAERLQTFGEAGYTRDRFAGIGHRVTATGGIAYATRLRPPHSLTIQGGLGMTVERRLDLSTLRFLTATGVLDYGWTIAPGIRLDQNVTLTTDLASARNWRGASGTVLSVTLTRVLSLKATHALEYRNQPVTNFGRTDMRTAVSLVFTMSR